MSRINPVLHPSMTRTAWEACQQSISMPTLASHGLFSSKREDYALYTYKIHQWDTQVATSCLYNDPIPNIAMTISSFKELLHVGQEPH